jgi:hypothetical protein
MIPPDGVGVRSVREHRARYHNILYPNTRTVDPYIIRQLVHGAGTRKAKISIREFGDISLHDLLRGLRIQVIHI